MTECRPCRVCAPFSCMTSFRDIPHSATKEGVRLAVPAAVSDSSHVLLYVGVPTVTVGNKYAFSLARQHFISQTVFCKHVCAMFCTLLHV